MFQTKKALEKEGRKVARARHIPEGIEVVDLPLSMIEPINKVQEPHFYVFVKESIEAHGLYHPLVIHPISTKDWIKEMELDKWLVPPRKDSGIVSYRIQCGCNRFFALQEMGYDDVECIIVEDLKEAQDLCHVLRIDKRWQRGSNWEAMHGQQILRHI